MAEKPLADLTVIELCQNVAGPFAGLVLAQLGARVIKVERPRTGDDTRRWGPPFWGDESVMFTVMNAGKESVAWDLDDAGDHDRLLSLVDTADVFVASLRPSSLVRRGLDYEHLAARNRRLIYASISGFGNTGPLADAPGYDPLIQAFCGLMSVTGHEGAPPVRVGTSLVDMGTGMWVALGVLAALHDRTTTGDGAHVTASLLETGLAWLPYQLVGYLATGREPGRMGSGLPMIVPYQAFPTADRHIVIAAGNDELWRRLCSALGLEDLGEDPDLATNPQRVANRERVVAELERALAGDTAESWQVRLAEAEVPCAVVNSIGDVLTHEQTRALRMIEPVDHPDIAEFRLPGLPLLVDGWRPQPDNPAPSLGDSTLAVERPVSRGPAERRQR